MKYILLLLFCSATLLAQTVSGPATSTTNALVTFRDATGKRLKDNPGALFDGTNLTLNGWIALSGLSNRLSVANGVLLLDGSALQGALGATSAITGSNATMHGWLKLSGETNEIGDNGTAITFNGTAVGGGGDTVWTNVGPGTVRLFNDLDSVRILESTGGLMIGPNAEAGFGPISSADGLILLRDPLNGDAGNFQVSFTSVVDVNEYSYYAESLFMLSTNSVSLQLVTEAPSGTSGFYFNADAGAASMQVKTDSTITFGIDSLGTATANAGFASTDTTAAVSIAETGYTNLFGKQAVVDFDGTAMTWTVYDNAGTALYTNSTAHSGAMSRVLQPSGAIVISGTGVIGRASPF